MSKSSIPDQPPWDLDTEQRVIVSILLNSEYRKQCFESLDKNDFYKTSHILIFQKCGEMQTNGHPVDSQTLWSSLNEAEQKQIGSLSSILQLETEIPISADIKHHISILKEHAARRRILELKNSIEKRCRRKGSDLNKIDRDARLMLDEIQSSTKATGRSLFNVVTFDDIFTSELKINAPIADGLIDEGEFAIMYGTGGTGKSVLSLDLAMSLGAGVANLWDLFPIPKPRITMFVQSENTWATIKTRMTMKCGGDSRFVGGLQNITSPLAYDDILISGDVSDKKFKAGLIDYAEQVKQILLSNIDLIIFDPLISYHAADENDNSRMRTTLDSIAETSNAIGATPVVIHHTNRQGDIRGASAIFDWARNIIGVADKSFSQMGKTVKQVEITNDKRNNARPFEKFILRMDENLNFTYIAPQEIISQKVHDRCLKVKEALELMGGVVNEKSAFVNQYMEISLTKEKTANKHIDEAVENNYIKREYYRDGKLKKARYFLPEK
jgi:hypothetical protein